MKGSVINAQASNSVTRLGDALVSLEDRHALWRFKGRSVTVVELCHAQQIQRAQLSAIMGSRVALLPRSNLELAWQLFCLDGAVEAILIIPFEQSIEVQKELCENAKCDFVIGDLEGCEIPKVQFLSAQEAISLSRSDSVTNSESGHLDTDWIIPTSGTSGVPKLVSYKLSELTSSTKRNQRRGKAITWGLLYDLGRFAGLQVFLQALFGGSALVFTDREEDLEARIAALSFGDCNALSATPSLWRKIMMLPDLSRLNLKWITLGGEIADQQILEILTHRFADSRITHVYASTEAGVGFSVTDGLEGFPASYLDSSRGAAQLRVDESGKLWLRKLNSKQHYINADLHLCDDSGWIDSGDIVKRSADEARYVFLGRENGSINVGGSKVHPAVVERVIQSVHGVKMVSVVARKNPILGNLVEAIVVADEGSKQEFLKKEITKTCQEELERFQRPAFVRFRDEIELSANGKLERK